MTDDCNQGPVYNGGKELSWVLGQVMMTKEPSTAHDNVSLRQAPRYMYGVGSTRCTLFCYLVP